MALLMFIFSLIVLAKAVRYLAASGERWPKLRAGFAGKKAEKAAHKISPY